MNYKPTGDRVVLELLPQDDMTSGGIILPDSAKASLHLHAKVLAVGPGKRSPEGKYIPSGYEVGQKVLLGRIRGIVLKQPSELNPASITLTDADEILAIVTE